MVGAGVFDTGFHSMVENTVLEVGPVDGSTVADLEEVPVGAGIVVGCIAVGLVGGPEDALHNCCKYCCRIQGTLSIVDEIEEPRNVSHARE